MPAFTSAKYKGGETIPDVYKITQFRSAGDKANDPL